MVTMEIKLKALKFEAGEQLAAFVEKKVSRLARFCEGLSEEVEVAGGTRRPSQAR